MSTISDYATGVGKAIDYKADPTQGAEPSADPATETGNMRADVYNHFRNKGYSDAEASALTANAEAESGFNPTADEPFRSQEISFDDQGKPTNLNLSDEQTGNNGLLSDENNNPKTSFDKDQVKDQSYAKFTEYTDEPIKSGADSVNPDSQILNTLNTFGDDNKKNTPNDFSYIDKNTLAEKFSNQEKFELAKEETLKLKNGIQDPQGNTVKFIFDEENKKQVEGLVNHLISGVDKNSYSASRTFATTLIKETVENPDFILKQANGRNSYVAYWKDANNLTHEVIISMDKNDKGKIITSYPYLSKGGKAQQPLNRIYSKIKNADEMVFISNNIKENYDRVQSGYSRTQASARVSTENTPSAHLAP